MGVIAFSITDPNGYGISEPNNYGIPQKRLILKDWTAFMFEGGSLIRMKDDARYLDHSVDSQKLHEFMSSLPDLIFSECGLRDKDIAMVEAFLCGHHLHVKEPLHIVQYRHMSYNMNLFFSVDHSESIFNWVVENDPKMNIKKVMEA